MTSYANDLFLMEEDLFESFLEEEEFLTAVEDMQFVKEQLDCNTLRKPSTKKEDVIVVKSAKKDAGPKLRRRIFRPRSGAIDNNAAITSVLYRKQLRRRGSDFMLYAFPSFDRCDSLLFLPSTMMTHINRSDMTGLSKLFHTYMDKDCTARMTYLSDDAIDVTGLLKFHSLLDVLNPDAIVCVHSTKVIENQIHATAYTKYTASKTIYDSVARSVSDPVFMPMFGLQREESIIRNIKREGRCDDEANKLLHVVSALDSGRDLLLYLQLDLVFTFDDFTKKITRYQVSERITSIEPVDRALPIDE